MQKKRTRKAVSRLTTALPIAASALRESNSYLGAQFRHLRVRLGPPKAITAMAAKQAQMVYRMLKYGQEHVDKGTAQYEEKYQQQKLKLITKQAAEHGFALIPLVSRPRGPPIPSTVDGVVSGEREGPHPRLSYA